MKQTTSVKRQLDEYCKQLRLPTIRECYEQTAEQAAKEPLSYPEFLLALLEQECDARRENRIERRLRESHLPLEKSIETFDMKRLVPHIMHQAKSLMDGSFVDRNENVLAFGNPGSGKTHLLCAICIELIQKGHSVFYYNTNLLVQELLEAKRNYTLPRMLKKLSCYDVLLIDDLGYVQQSREEMEVLFTLLAERYERGSVMITSNLPFSKWETIFKDPVTTAAVIDRLVHHSIILELNLPSYRMEHAKKGMINYNQEEQPGREL